MSASTTSFTWDVNTSIPQVLDDEDLRYVYGLGRIAQVGADTHYYLADGLGSTMALTDDDGDIVNTYDYDVFGAERASSGTQDNDFTFAGEQVDGSTGLQYLLARYYDPEMGSFSSRDPILEGIVNRAFPYGYADANPVNLSDPTGWEPSEPVPVPLPPPGSHDDSQCIAGWAICTDPKSWNRKELERLIRRSLKGRRTTSAFTR